MEARRDVREEHERGRRNGSLRRIHDADLPPARAGGRMLRSDFSHESIELAGAHPVPPRLGYAIDHLQQPGCPLAACGRDVHDGRPVEELELPTYLLIETLG